MGEGENLEERVLHRLKAMLKKIRKDVGGGRGAGGGSRCGGCCCAISLESLCNTEGCNFSSSRQLEKGMKTWLGSWKKISARITVQMYLMEDGTQNKVKVSAGVPFKVKAGRCCRSGAVIRGNKLKEVLWISCSEVGFISWRRYSG